LAHASNIDPIKRPATVWNLRSLQDYAQQWVYISHKPSPRHTWEQVMQTIELELHHLVCSGIVEWNILLLTEDNVEAIMNISRNSFSRCLYVVWFPGL
jgi:hypothetical protein